MTKRICSIEECERPHSARGLCEYHYTKARRDGSIPIAKRKAPMRNPPSCCTVSDCDRKHYAKGYCHKHYVRVWKNGTLIMKRANNGEHLQWLEANSRHEGDDCLAWPFKSRDSRGYALASIEGRMRVASRVMCELRNGPPPEEGLVCAHNCGKGHLGCVNPKHLRWTTQKDNIADKVKHGTLNCGSNHYASKLTIEDVEAIIASPKTSRELSREIGVSAGHIRYIRCGGRWARALK